MPEWVWAQSVVSGTLEGNVSTQQGQLRLPGALVELTTPSGAVLTARTDVEGRFRFVTLPPGRYRVHTSLSGFRASDSTVVIESAGTRTLNVDMRVSAAETVNVTPAQAGAPVPDVTTLASAVVGAQDVDQFAPGGGFQDAMRLTSAVIDTPEGLSIKGAHPDESSVQLDADTAVEPSTSLAPMMLPSDAVDSVAVLPNPYAAEFGRFSAGVVVIRTRSAGDQWHLRLNDFDPDFRTKRSANFSVIGVRSFTPHIELGGPMGKRVFFEQTVQYRYDANDIPSLPETELTTKHWLSTFTRADIDATKKQSFVVSGGLFQSRTNNATLGTFVPPDAAADLGGTLVHTALIARSLWSDAVQTESTVSTQYYDLDTYPHGDAPMVLQPDTASGNFFTRQHRDTATFQFTDAVTAIVTGPRVIHAFKAGIDVLGSMFSGVTVQAPVLIEDPSGTVVRRLDFVGATAEQANSLDAGLYAEDRMDVGHRVALQFGARVDRDGTLRRVNAAPRFGVSFALDESGSRVVRAGFGLFTDRTPLIAATFSELPSMRDDRVLMEGATAADAPVLYQNTVSPDMRTARSAVWSVSYEHRISRTWSWHTAYLDRRGLNQLIVTPVQAPFASALLLTSDGRSSYRDGEIGVHFTHAPGFDVEATYTRSTGREDLNRFLTYFGSVASPVLTPNVYGPSSTDAPNRLFVRARLQTTRWLLLSIFDWHTGLPFSVVDASLDVVGERNGSRLPAVRGTQIGVERRFRIGGLSPWIGVEIENPFNTFSPVDVQANIASGNFGALYNSAYRRTRLIIRFAR